MIGRLPGTMRGSDPLGALLAKERRCAPLAVAMNENLSTDSGAQVFDAADVFTGETRMSGGGWRGSRGRPAPTGLTVSRNSARPA